MGKVIKRFKPILLDHIVMTIVVVLIISIVSIDKWLLLILIGFYINKDIFYGRSLSKFIFGYQVIDNRYENVAKPVQCLLRNLTVIIWPVEVILLLVGKGKRLGDYLSGTKVVTVERGKFTNYFSSIEFPSIKSILLVLIITAGYLFLLTVLLPI